MQVNRPPHSTDVVPDGVIIPLLPDVAVIEYEKTVIVNVQLLVQPVAGFVDV